MYLPFQPSVQIVSNRRYRPSFRGDQGPLFKLVRRKGITLLPGPCENWCNWVSWGLVALLVLPIVARDCTVSGFGFNGLKSFINFIHLYTLYIYTLIMWHYTYYFVKKLNLPCRLAPSELRSWVRESRNPGLVCLIEHHRRSFYKPKRIHHPTSSTEQPCHR